MEAFRMIVALGLFVVVAIVIVVVMARMFRGFFRTRWRIKVEPHVAVEDPIPAAPVRPTMPLEAAAALIIIWSVMHLAVISYWSMTGYLVPRKSTWIFSAAYAGFAAIISGIGGIMLLRRRRFGRKMVAWGEFFFGTMAFMMLISSLVMPTDTRSPEHLRDIGYYLAAFFAVHMLVDTVLGTAAQRAGRPVGWTEPPARAETQAQAFLQEPLDSQESPWV